MSLTLAPFPSPSWFNATLPFPCTSTLNLWWCWWRQYLKFFVKHDHCFRPLRPPLNATLFKQASMDFTCKVDSTISASLSCHSSSLHTPLGVKASLPINFLDDHHLFSNMDPNINIEEGEVFFGLLLNPKTILNE